MSNKNCNTHKNNNNLDKFFDDLLGGFEGIFGKDMKPLEHSSPKTNVIEKDDAYVLEIAAPGWSKSDFDIHLDKNILTVEVNQEKLAEPKEGKRFVRKEFSKRSLKRSFHLPENADKDNIGAKYSNGVLHISIAKLVEATISHKIEIK